jgi:DNA-binding MurR/RpiR family transcriptional regulator
MLSRVDVLSQIKLNRNTFTKAERSIADYVLNHSQKVLYMSITDLAAACKVGDTSVFRFCKTLELQGYQEFKMYLAQSIDVGESAGEAGDGTLREQDLMHRILETDVSALRETCALLKQNDLENVVKLMFQARRICFFGVGSSMITAMEACSKFMRIMPNVENTCDGHLQAMQAALLEPQDLAFIVSYSGSTKDAVEIAKICKGNGVKVICVTRFLKSPLRSYADIALICGSNEGPLQGGSLSAKIAELYIIDVLYNECFRQDNARMVANRDKTASAILDKMY